MLANQNSNTIYYSIKTFSVILQSYINTRGMLGKQEIAWKNEYELARVCFENVFYFLYLNNHLKTKIIIVFIQILCRFLTCSSKIIKN